MRRLTIPSFVRDVVDDRAQRGILIAGALSMLAVGLVPRVLSPGLPTSQEQLRLQPELQNLYLLLSFLSAATVIAGGLVSDLFRRRALLTVSLAVMVAAALVSAVLDDGPPFYAANVLAIAASGVVLAYAIGSVAVAYEGVPRATALGVVYAAYGAGSALAPAVLTALPRLIPSEVPGGPSSFSYETTAAYLISAIAAGVGLWAAHRWMPRLPGGLPAPARLVVRVAVWTTGVLAIVTGVLGLASAAGPIVPWALIVGGTIGVGYQSIHLRRTAAVVSGLRLDERALGAALTVGVAVGFAQSVPLMLLPVVFEFPLRYGAIFAMLAIAPFVLALLLAGPVSGMLLARYGPRGIMAAGTFALGLANLLLAFVLGSVRLDAHYIVFVVPLVFIGAGFVLSTTVRTAIVFASTPRGLPASAAALNEASVGMGSRIGIVIGTTLVAIVAYGAASSMAADRPDAGALLDEFRSALGALGTPRFREVYATTLEFADLAKRQAFAFAYLDGVAAALFASGVVGIGGALVAWFLTGRRDPLRTVFDMQDERTAA